MDDRFRLVINAEFEHVDDESLEKGGAGKKKKRMIVKGLVSEATKDADGETLLPSGFDLSYLKTHGFINWNHQAKKDPEMIIGVPLEKGTEVADGKFMIRAELFDSELGLKVFKLGNLLKKSESPRKLAFSLEGYATKRNKDDKKIVEKAMITHVAVTPAPKNKSSYLELSDKGFSGEASGDPDAILDTVKDCQGNELCLMGSCDIKELSKSLDGEAAVATNVEGNGAGGEATPSVGEALTIIGKAHSLNLLSKAEIEGVRGLFEGLV